VMKLLDLQIKTNEHRRIVAYLDGLYPGGHLRQAKVNALRGLGLLLSIPLPGTFGGHLPIKGKTSLWALAVSRAWPR
ncbi:MAG: hypothetical protein ABI621_09830, partial [Chloroflexota bacterium]